MLGSLLAVDAVLVALHVFGYYGLNVLGERWSIHTDGGYPEIVQYVKCLVAAVLALVGAARRSPSLAVWAAILAYIALDDMLRLHEQAAGIDVVERLTAGRDVPQQVLGELVVAGSIGLVTVSLVAIGWWAACGAARRAHVDLLALIVLFGAFSVLVDLVHGMVGGSWAGMALGVLEDGGELVVLSLVVAYAVHLVSGGAPLSVLDRSRHGSVRDAGLSGPG